MHMARYIRPEVRYKDTRPSKAVPDQSLSVQEIVRRYVRGIPVDVVQREAVYLDQSEIDLERVSRADFAEKAELANAMQARAQDVADQFRQAERKRSDAKAAAIEKQRAGTPPAGEPKGGNGEAVRPD